MLMDLYLKYLILFLPQPSLKGGQGGEGVINTNISYKRIVRNAKLKPSVILDEKYFFSFEPIN
jgi:hypothetical protein